MCVSKLWLSKPAAEACLELGADSIRVGRSATWCQGLQKSLQHWKDFPVSVCRWAGLQDLTCCMVLRGIGPQPGSNALQVVSRMQGSFPRALHRGVGCCGSRQSLFLAARNARGCHSESSCVTAHFLSPAGTIQGLPFTCPTFELLCVRVARGLLDPPNTA